MIDMDVIHIFALKDNKIFGLNRKVEEMQKALEWYADENTYNLEYKPIISDNGNRARQALKGVPNDLLTNG